MGKSIQDFCKYNHMIHIAPYELTGIEQSNLSHIERASTKLSLQNTAFPNTLI